MLFCVNKISTGILPTSYLETSKIYSYLLSSRRFNTCKCFIFVMACRPSSYQREFFLALHNYVTSAIHPPSPCIRLRCATAVPVVSLKGQSRLFAGSTRVQKESLGPQNHYEMFPSTLQSGPPPTGPFSINLRQLRKEFLQLQAQAHPDRHQGENKARAEGLSSRINEAYKTLQNPLLRAQYLLRLRGIDVAEDETAKVEDPALLMDVLEMRETIEEVEDEKDLESLKEHNNANIQESERVLERAFQDNDIEMAKDEAVKLRYWINIKDSLNSWEKGKPVVLVH